MNSSTPGLPVTICCGRHDIELYGAAILGDGFLDGGDTGHIDRRHILQAGQYFLRLGLRQFPERAGVLVDLDKERPDLRVDVGIGRDIGGGARGHHGCSKEDRCQGYRCAHRFRSGWRTYRVSSVVAVGDGEPSTIFQTLEGKSWILGVRRG